MNNKECFKNFEPVSSRELQEINGGWGFLEVICVIALICGFLGGIAEEL